MQLFQYNKANQIKAGTTNVTYTYTKICEKEGTDCDKVYKLVQELLKTNPNHIQ